MIAGSPVNSRIQKLSLFLGACSMLLVACEPERVASSPGLVIATYVVGSAVDKREGIFHGRVVPADLTRVSFRIPGKIDHLAVQAGQAVIAGQTLAQIEDSIQRQGLADAKAQYELSRRQLERAENLHRRGSLSTAQRDQLQAGFRLARANFSLAEAALSYTVVKAPFDGTVAEVDKELYEAVAAGETVVSVYRNDRTDVLVEIPDILPAKIHQARDIAALQTSVVFSGSPTAYRMGFLKASTARNPKTQAFQLWLTMPAPPVPFPLGLPATVTTDLQDAGFSTDSGLVVPLTALEAGAREDAFRVWRYEDGIVNPVAVQVVRITRDGALVSGELRAGDIVANSSLSRLSAGQSVDIQSDKQGQ